MAPSDVIAKLQSLTRERLDLLPAGSFIAGGSVSNILLNEARDLSLPINDIDVFIRTNEVSDKIDNADEASEYFDPTTSEEIVNYKITKVTDRGRLNSIYYSSSMSHPGLMAKGILKSFDFNCVQAGLLKLPDGSWEEHATLDFVDCLKTGQVRLVAIKYPFWTLIRYHKKQAELKGLYFDSNEPRAIIDTIAHHGDLASQKTVKKYLNLCGKQYRGVFEFHRIKNADAKFGALYKISVTPNSPNRTVFQRKITKTLGTSLSKTFSFFRFFAGRSAAQKARILEIGSYPHLFRHVISNQVVIPRHQIQRKSLRKADFTLREFPQLMSRSVLRKLEDQVGFILNLCEQVKDHPVVGVDPEDRRAFFGFVGAISLGIESPRDLIDAFTNSLQKAYYLRLVEPLNLDLEGVRELLTRADLNIEGREQGHCVGGYSSSLSTGESRIFAIRVGNNASTIEVGVNEGLAHAYIRQHRGRFNGAPASENAVVAMELIRAVRKLGKIENTSQNEEHSELEKPKQIVAGF